MRTEEEIRTHLANSPHKGWNYSYASALEWALEGPEPKPIEKLEHGVGGVVEKINEIIDRLNEITKMKGK